MERVLKRVGLSKRSQSDVKPSNENDINTTTRSMGDGANTKVRRRRRSKSRRRSNEEKKTRGLFNIDWESVKDCKSCKSRAITRRFCSKRCDNELYRSNSFKFERFIRGNDDNTSTFGKKISLCDDYSLPVDHLNKKRPNSIAVPSVSEWNVSSPNEEKIEILETYSTPRDSKQQLNQEDLETKCFTSPDREYSQPYTTEGSSEQSSDDDVFGHCLSITKPQELNSPDSIAEAILPSLNIQSPNRCDIKRHPSPYYYGDLYKNKSDDVSLEPASNTFKQKIKGTVVESHNISSKSLSLSLSTTTTKQQQQQQQKQHTQVAFESKTHQNYHHQKRNSIKKYTKKSVSLDQTSTNRPIRSKSYSKVKYKKSSSVDTQSTDSRDAPITNNVAMPSNRLNSPSCGCFTPDYGLDDEMTRQRHVYETAFDCRINKSDDDLDQIDKISNHSVLVQFNNSNREIVPGPSQDNNTSQNNRRKVTLLCPNNKLNQTEDSSTTSIVQKLQDMHLPIDETSTSATSALSLPLRGYTPSPPSTAPLPTKFPGKELVMNSIRSTPNLPSHPKLHIKDLHLPVKSLRGRKKDQQQSTGSFLPESDIDFSNNISEFKGRPKSKSSSTTTTTTSTKSYKNCLFDIKGWPKKDNMLLKRSKENKEILEFKVRRRRHKYSSTESITTSSSGGSMESIKSSTSEGNRSTTSSESRQSSSLSSHSSDSGSNPQYTSGQNTGFLLHTNKLHILSPISDKSSQEPISETSDNNRNNNSQKCSPEEVATPDTIKTTKRRLPQNKNLLNLSFNNTGADPEIQGSDSGISIQSREGIINKPRFGFTTCSQSPHQDFNELPFDMPKLRRRRMVLQDACTSSSATSVDLRDLPFDMPKLRRRLRIQLACNNDSSVSQASSSQSVVEADRQVTTFRPKLTLNLEEIGVRQQRPIVGLTLGLNINNIENSAADIIDINLPLEKQGWFHGAITRVEAENVLKTLKEGSFLVRNSESTKQDYSLSLKSARGFMHMRIQKDGTDESYILGQFSKPFNSIPEMIRHFCVNRLPIRGAEHMCLLQPVIAQLL